MISNCTGRPVFCWMMVARLRMVPPLTRSPMRSFDEVAPAQFAVDRKVEKGAIAQLLVADEVEPNGPNVAWP